MEVDIKMQGRVDNMHHHLPGVKCVVNTCHYHATDDCCTAEKIEIQHRNATTSKDTDCATFAPK